MIKAGVWNVRGLNGAGHQATVGQLVRDHNLQFLGLLETRVRQGNEGSIRSNLLRTWDWFSDYPGPGGRIWLAWNPLEVDVQILQVELQLIHCRVTNRTLHTNCLIYVIYGDCDIIPRRALWDGLISLSEGITDDAWSVLGDFNVVWDTSEIRGRMSDSTTAMTEFRDCITAAALVHLPFTGCQFSWHNCSQGSRSQWKRLDRVLVNEEWLVRWPRTQYISALPSTSDHSPLILSGYDTDRAKGIFRFDNFLAKMPGFLESVQHIWNHRIYGTQMYGVTTKMKALKQTFRAQRKVRGDLSNNVCLAKGFLEQAQRLYDTYKEHILLQLVNLCRILYCSAVQQELSMLHQRAKLHWLKYGDQSSKIFFRKIKANRARQRICQITSSTGELLTETSMISNEFVTYYQGLLGGTRAPRVLDLSFLRTGLKHTITSEEALVLTSPIAPQEVKDAFFDISEDSAPGPDGYTSAFFKAAWPVIGGDVCAAVVEFFQTGRLLKQINATLLTLIPKVHLPSRVSDFRPIACCNVLYKAISKILVRRLHTVLPLMIDYSQNAFIPGRSIADNVMLAQELLAGYNQSKLPPRCTIKIDIQKAYDSVHWDFILDSLRIFNFPPRFICWIEQCISTASFSISLNGSIHGFFPGTRGIRQGDPISPYLFVIVMEIWHVLLKLRIQNSDSFQYHWKCRDLGIVNLCFADDVLIFCSGTVDSVSTIREVLAEFAALSGLEVNPGKSQIILSRSVSCRQQILETVGFHEGSLPIKYLGVPLVSSRLTIADCRPLIHKLDCRLAGWEQLNLSLAGRTQLIRSVLSSLHTYWASVFILPKSVISVIEQRMRNFLWKGATGSGYAKVSWAQVCRPKVEGLGIRRVLFMNQALMMKHLWRVLQADTSSIWVAWVLRYRLNKQTIWTFRSSNSSWCWNKLIKLSVALRAGLEYRVGNGHRFTLWTDIWHPQGPLLCSFPRGPSITGLPSDSLLKSVIRQTSWDWPSESAFDIQEIIAGLPTIFPNQPDTILWRFNGGRFTSGSALTILQPAYPAVYWHHLLRGKFKIPRHCFILWLAILERLSTRDRPWMQQHNSGCVLCAGLFVETHDHIFFEMFIFCSMLGNLATSGQISLARIWVETGYTMGK
ncbi:UNVERIFIED_CONTAM: hypothetical protein Sradi_7012500 [Sesamum radiatum]|uniref:Reverse transcriptase domain-containing protein n=1 Tax=Sesamum radiatum TaxID=300843 RepID=A0AAW2JDZ9_SESRA